MRSDAQRNYDQLLATARAAMLEEGVNASLREIARRSGVGLGTVYRHFPTREALLEALLQSEFDVLALKAAELEEAADPAAAVFCWLRETVAVACKFRGLTEAMGEALADPKSPLHAACVALQSAGTRLLARAQAQGLARPDLDGGDLSALVRALAWLCDQPALARRAEHLLGVIAGAILIQDPKVAGPLQNLHDRQGLADHVKPGGTSMAGNLNHEGLSIDR